MEFVFVQEEPELDGSVSEEDGGEPEGREPLVAGNQGQVVPRSRRSRWRFRIDKFHQAVREAMVACYRCGKKTFKKDLKKKRRPTHNTHFMDMFPVSIAIVIEVFDS